MLPNFLVIGAMKAGSTSLFQYLRVHPQVFMPAQKELHFFADQAWERGVAWYERFFDAAGDAIAVGEASPGYSRYPFSPDTPARMAGLIPDARLVYVIREPVDRIVSQWRHMTQVGSETRPLAEAALDERVYVSSSRYGLQIERYLAHFDRSQLLVVLSEDLRDRRLPTVRSVLRFLGVDGERVPATVGEEFNRADGQRRGRPSVRRLRETKAFAVVRSRAPAPVRAALWRAASRPVAPVAVDERLPDAVRAEVVRLLQPDLELLRGHLGPRFDGWRLLDEGT